MTGEPKEADGPEQSGGQDAEHDPAQAWAREHYGFLDESATTPSASASPVSAPQTRPRTRSRTLVAAGLASRLLAGGVGGVAIASVDDSGRGGGSGFDGGRGGGNGFAEGRSGR